MRYFFYNVLRFALGVNLPKALCGLPVLYIHNSLSNSFLREAAFVGAFYIPQ